MSMRVAVIWVVIAAALSVAAAIMPSGGSGRDRTSADKSAVLAADLTGVREITIERADRSVIRLKAGAGVDAWTMRTGDGPAWPVEPGRVRALLRIMSDMEGTIVADHMPAPTATTLTLRGGDGATQATLRLDTGRIAGLAVITIDEQGATRSLRVPDALHRAFEGQGPLAWRDRRAFPGLSPDLARITIRTPDVEIELARVAGRWGMRLPVQALADADAVDAIWRALAMMETDRLMDSDADAFPGDTRISIIAEADRRDMAGEARTIERWSLDLGGVAPGGGAFLARLRGDLTETRNNERNITYGPIIAELKADRLASVPGAAEPYISRVLLSAPAADVGLLTIEGPASGTTIWRRTAGGWLVQRGSTAATPAIDADRQLIGELVQILSETRAERVGVLPSEETLAGGLGVAIDGLSGQRLEICRLFVDTSEGRSAIVARTGRVTRAWPVRPELSAWLASQ